MGHREINEWSGKYAFLWHWVHRHMQKKVHPSALVNILGSLIKSMRRHASLWKERVLIWDAVSRALNRPPSHMVFISGISTPPSWRSKKFAIFSNSTFMIKSIQNQIKPIQNQMNSESNECKVKKQWMDLAFYRYHIFPCIRRPHV